MSTRGIFSTPGDTMVAAGDITKHVIVGDIMMRVGAIMSTVRGVQYSGRLICTLSDDFNHLLKQTEFRSMQKFLPSGKRSIDP